MLSSTLIFSSSPKTHLCYNRGCKSAASFLLSHERPFPSSDLMKQCVGTLISRWTILTGHRPHDKLPFTLDSPDAGRGVHRKEPSSRGAFLPAPKGLPDRCCRVCCHQLNLLLHQVFFSELKCGRVHTDQRLRSLLHSFTQTFAPRKSRRVNEEADFLVCPPE